jgi:hypothetical protein
MWSCPSRHTHLNSCLFRRGFLIENQFLSLMWICHQHASCFVSVGPLWGHQFCLHITYQLWISWSATMPALLPETLLDCMERIVVLLPSESEILTLVQTSSVLLFPTEEKKRFKLLFHGCVQLLELVWYWGRGMHQPGWSCKPPWYAAGTTTLCMTIIFSSSHMVILVVCILDVNRLSQSAHCGKPWDLLCLNRDHRGSFHASIHACNFLQLNI